MAPINSALITLNNGNKVWAVPGVVYPPEHAGKLVWQQTFSKKTAFSRLQWITTREAARMLECTTSGVVKILRKNNIANKQVPNNDIKNCDITVWDRKAVERLAAKYQVYTTVPTGYIPMQDAISSLGLQRMTVFRLAKAGLLQKKVVQQSSKKTNKKYAGLFVPKRQAEWLLAARNIILAARKEIDELIEKKVELFAKKCPKALETRDALLAYVKKGIKNNRLA